MSIAQAWAKETLAMLLARQPFPDMPRQLAGVSTVAISPSMAQASLRVRTAPMVRGAYGSQLALKSLLVRRAASDSTPGSSPLTTLCNAHTLSNYNATKGTQNVERKMNRTTMYSVTDGNQHTSKVLLCQRVG